MLGCRFRLVLVGDSSLVRAGRLPDADDTFRNDPITGDRVQIPLSELRFADEGRLAAGQLAGANAWRQVRAVRDDPCPRGTPETSSGNILPRQCLRFGDVELGCPRIREDQEFGGYILKSNTRMAAVLATLTAAVTLALGAAGPAQADMGRIRDPIP